MQRSRARRTGALLVGLTIVAAAQTAQATTDTTEATDDTATTRSHG